MTSVNHFFDTLILFLDENATKNLLMENFFVATWRRQITNLFQISDVIDTKPNVVLDPLERLMSAIKGL